MTCYYTDMKVLLYYIAMIPDPSIHPSSKHLVTGALELIQGSGQKTRLQYTNPGQDASALQGTYTHTQTQSYTIGILGMPISLA